MTDFAEKKALKQRFPGGFCSAPFSQIYIHATGDVYVCCQHQGHLGNLNDHTLEELWNGEKAKKLRREFLSGKPVLCKKNMDQIGCHINYDEFLDYVDFEEEQKEKPRMLEVVLNGKCNIACVMCEIKDTVQSVLRIPNFEREIQNKLFPALKHINIKGGEPLVQKETYHVLKVLKQVNPDCSWRFTTNGQYQFNNTIKKQLDGLNLERVTFSIDSCDPELFSSIRKNGSLDKCEKAMHEIQEWARTKDQIKPVNFTINITVQKENWKNVPETFRHYHQRGHSPCLIYVYYPDTFSLSTLSHDEIIDVLKYYIELPSEYDIYMGSFYHALKPLLILDQPQIRKLKLVWEMRLQENTKN